MPLRNALPEKDPAARLLEEGLQPVDRIGPKPPSPAAPCCGQPSASADRGCSVPGSANPSSSPSWVLGAIQTPAGPVLRVSTHLGLGDRLGSWKARWGIGRMDFQVAPGLYGAGEPGPESPVLVTANYKMSFDRVRQALGGLDAWILVLDTKGINVWCAAGKGTFGTRELASRVSSTGLAQIVTHRTLVVPQLGAPGVAAHDVKQQCGFRVQYGPVRAEDIPAFLKAGRATEAMRTVRFDFQDRLVLAPIELENLLRPATQLAALLFLLQVLGWLTLRSADLWPFLGAILCGAVIAPILLPWIPGRSFALKGWILGLAWAAAVIALKGLGPHAGGLLTGAAYALVLPAISSFLALNFTGASTYTSLSGVIRETRASVPAIRFAVATGLALWVLGRIQ